MSSRFGFLNRRQQRAFDAFWDMVVERSPAEPIRPALVDAASVAVIRRLHAIASQPVPAADFADRLFADLAQTIPEPGQTVTASSLSTSKEETTMTVSTITAPAPDVRRWELEDGRKSEKILSLPVIDRRTAFGLLAAAILLLLAGVGAGLIWFNGGDDQRPVIPAVVHPATQASPEDEISSEAEMVWEWTLTNTGNMEVDKFLRVVEGPDGVIYAVDTANGTIHLLDADGQETGVWGEPGTGPGQFNFGNPNNSWVGGDIDFDAVGNIYVFDSMNDRIQKFTPDREFIGEWPVPVGDNKEFAFPLGAVDRKNERVYVVTQADPKVLVFDLDGNPLSTWGGYGGGPGEFRFPTDVAVSPDGTIWISDRDISRIQHFESDGTYLGEIGSRGGEPGQIFQVMSLAFDSSGNIVVAEAGNGRVQFLRPDGTSEMVIDGAVGAGQLSGSSSAWVGSDGSLLVADSAKDRIVKIQLPI